METTLTSNSIKQSLRAGETVQNLPPASGSPDALVRALLEISGLVGSANELYVVLRRIVQITANLMQMPICSIYLIESDGTLRKRSNVGLSEDLRRQATFKPGEGIPGWVVQHGELVAVADVTKDPRYGRHPVALKEPHAYICAPLRIRDEIIGVMTARCMAVKEFTENQRRIFETASGMIAIVIEKHRIQQQNIRAQHLAAIATSLSEIAHYAKNVMFVSQLAESNIGRAIERGEGVDGIRDSWERLKRSNQKIRKLVDDMLNYSRDRDPQIESANFNDLVRNVVEDLRYHAQKHGVAINMDLDHTLPHALLDPSMIYDVLMNLVSNGIDAVPDGKSGQVLVRSLRSPDGGSVRIEVEDNGAGIPVGIQKKIFSLFFSTKGERGTGIGLAASRKAVDKHGGSIRFTTAEGKGTCFIVDLPLAPP